MLGCRSGNDGKNHGILFATQRGREESLRECRTMESTIKCLGEQSWCMTIRHRQQSPADSHATYRKCGFLCVKPERSPLNYMRHIFRFQGAKELLTPFPVVGVAPQQFGNIDSKHFRNRLQVRHRRTTRSPASDYAIANSGLYFKPMDGDVLLSSQFKNVVEDNAHCRIPFLSRCVDVSAKVCVLYL